MHPRTTPLPFVFAAVLLAPAIGMPADAFMLRSGQGPLDVHIVEFKGSVDDAGCRGNHHYQKKPDAHVALRLTSETPSVETPDPKFTVPVIIIALAGLVILALLSSDLEAPPPPEYDDIWEYQCTATKAHIQAQGFGAVLRRVSLEQHNPNTKQYEEIGKSCPYDGVVVTTCTAEWHLTENDTPYAGPIIGSTNDRPDKGCVGYPELVRAVNAPQHWALEDVIPTRIRGDPELTCLPDKEIKWCRTDLQQCDPLQLADPGALAPLGVDA